MKHEHGIRWDRLYTAVMDGFRHGAVYRRNRARAVKQYVGQHYASGGSRREVPINLIELAVSVFVRALAPRAPRVLVRTPSVLLLPFARKLESAFNKALLLLRFNRTVRRWVMESMFGPSFLKVGYNGALYADVVDLDDLTIDWHARVFERVSFIGSKVRVPRADAFLLFEPEAVEALPIASYRDALRGMGGASVQKIGAGDQTWDSSWRDEVEFFEVFLPRERLTVWFGEGGQEPIAVRPWEGPESGPYIPLAFSDVPGNLMPLPPVATWMDNHLLVNSIRRKLGRQAERLKELLLASSASEADVTRIKDASDGEMIRVDNPQGVSKQMFGGADQSLFALMMQLKATFKELAGNLDAIGGLAPQSDTLGQDQMLRGAASVRMQDMHAQVMDALRSAMLNMGWYIWHKDLGIKAEVPWGFEASFLGTGAAFELGGEESREGAMDDYEFTIQPYSMESQTPQQLAGLVQSVWTQTILPIAPLLAQQGVTPNVEGVLKLLARLTNFDELEQLVSFAGGEPGEQHSANPDMVLKSPTSLREYRRTSVSGTAPQGREQAMISTMMGAKVQEKETAGMIGG